MRKQLLCAFVLSAIAFVAPIQCLAQGVPVNTRLPNGLQLIVVPDKLAPVVTTVLSYRVGSDDDTMPGIAHATEHMMFRSMTGLSAAQLGDIAARMGGDFNAETTNESTQYYFVAPRQYLPLILHIEALRMNGAYIAPGEWAHERGAIEQEVRGDESNPYFAVSNELRQAMLGGTPYATNPVGTVDSFTRMTADDIRAFYRTWYHPNNATLVISGDVSPGDVARQVRAIFGAIPAVRLPGHAAVTLPPLRPTTLQRTINVPSPSVAMAFRYPSLSSRDFAASIVLYIALENARGPLAQLNMSRKVSGAQFSIGQFAQAGYAYLSADVPPNGTTAQVQADLTAYLQSILRDGVSPEFVAIAKQRILSGRDTQLAAISGLAQSWAQATLQGTTPQAIYDAFAQVTPANVDRVLRTCIRPDSDVVAIIAPAASQKNVVLHLPAPASEQLLPPTPTSESLPLWAQSFFRHNLAATPIRKTRAFRLSNGVTVAFQQQSVAPLVTLVGAIKLNETLHAPRGKDGVAEITSALMTWGGGGYTREQIAAAADGISAGILPGAQFRLVVPAKNFDRAMALLAAEELHPAFPVAGFKVLQQEIGAYYGRIESQPDWTARLATEAALYPPTDPVRRHPSAATIATVTLDDVKKWYANAYRPDMTAIAIVGDIDPTLARKEIDKYFGSWRTNSPKPDFHYPPVLMNGPANSAVRSPNAKQTVVQFTELLPIHRDNPDYTYLELADTILTGEGEDSLLFTDLRRDAGLVYNVSSTLDIGVVRSTYQFEFASDPQNAAAATSKLVADLRRLQNELIPSDDLLRAKQMILARSVLPQQSYTGLANTLVGEAAAIRDHRIASGNPIKRMLSATPQQVRDALRKWVRVNDFVQTEVVPGTP